MSEIKLHIEEQYLKAFLNFLKTLNYVSVKEVSGNEENSSKALSSEIMLQNLTPEDPLLKAIHPLRKGLTAGILAQEQGYQGTNWDRVEQLAKEMDIREPIENLLDQLTS